MIRTAALSFLLSLALAGSVSPARAETWVSRMGSCYQWEGQWDMQQEPSGVWVGRVDYFHVGGPCAPGTGNHLPFEARGLIVGEEFVGRRTNGTRVCHVWGIIRSNEVRADEFCSGFDPGPVIISFEPQRRR